jgi:hypothetical protein
LLAVIHFFFILASFASLCNNPHPNGPNMTHVPSSPLHGRIGTLTPEQEKALSEFKSQLTARALFNAERHDDHLLCRFLRARKFDLVKTMEMFSNCERWRQEKKVDEIYETFTFDEHAAVQALYPRYYHQTDKLGRPLYIEQLGKLDLEQLFKITTRERLEKFFILEYERVLRLRMPACSEAAGKHVETSFTILDMKNCSVMQAFKIKELLKLIIDIGQNYYPETMGMTFIINAPWVFDTVWSIVKMWLDEVTVNKIKIFKSGKDYAGALFQLVDPTSVPFTLGGTCKCEGGCENSDLGPWKKQTQ